MIEVALRGLLGRKLRAVLTALAIVLGVSMVSGTYILTDTIDSAFDDIFVESRADTSVVISGKKVVERSASGKATVPASLLKKVRSVPNVEAAAGSIEDSARIIGRNGKAITTFGPPTFGYGIDFGQPRFNPLKLAEGSWPSGPTEVAIDRATADAEDFTVGEMVGISARGPAREFRLAGIVKFGDVESLGGATIAAFDVSTAQEIFEKKGKLDSISVAAKSGVSPDQLVQEIRPILPASVEAKTGSDQAAADAEEITSRLSFLEYFLLAFGGISLFVGAFVIFNTLSITVAQRIREFATMRTLGASRRQVLGSIAVETLVIGSVASVIGLFFGLVLAKALNAIFIVAGIKLPQGGTVFATRTVVVSLLVGIVIAVVAGLVPALRATRVPPISAVREGATLPKSRLAPFAAYIAGSIVAVAGGLLGYGMFAGGLGTAARLVLLAIGCLLLFIGVALLSTRLVGPLASVLGKPSERIGGLAGLLARENSIRNPSRTAATAAALMIGLALVTFVAVLGEGLRTSIVDTLAEQVNADYVVSSQNNRDPFDAAAGDAVAKAPGVELATSVRGDSARVAGSENTVTGIDPATIASFYRLDWEEGSDTVLGELGKNGAIVTDSLAEDKNLAVGSRFQVVTPDNKKLKLVVKGIFKPPALGSPLGAAAISQATFESTFRSPKNQNTYVNVQGDPSDSAEKALEQALAPFPDAKLQTKAEFVDAQAQLVETLLALLYVLLALSVIVSLFGMVNTLVLAIVERTRELGMLRAVGMTRRQVRMMVRHESVITALIGAALGLPLGIFLAALVTRALADEGIVFAVPVVSLVVFAIAAAAAGILAAILPARRASRLNVLNALQYE